MNLREHTRLYEAMPAHTCSCWCGLGDYTDPAHTHACIRPPGPRETPPMGVSDTPPPYPNEHCRITYAELAGQWSAKVTVKDWKQYTGWYDTKAEAYAAAKVALAERARETR